MELEKLMTTEAHEKGAEVEIKDPTTFKSFEKPVFITVVGVGSKKFRAIKSKIMAESLELKADGHEIDANAQMVKVLASSTIGWRGIEKDNKPLEFSVEQAEKLYLGSDFVYDQVIEFIGNRENFTPG